MNYRTKHRSKSAVHRILVVDDSRMARASVMRHLKDYFLLAEASDGESAWRMIQEEPGIKVVLTDLEMPRMGGLELLRIIRSNEIGKNLPVLVMAKEEGEGALRAARENGADWVFDNTVPWERVLSVVDKAIEGKRNFDDVESSSTTNVANNENIATQIEPRRPYIEESFPQPAKLEVSQLNIEDARSAQYIPPVTPPNPTSASHQGERWEKYQRLVPQEARLTSRPKLREEAPPLRTEETSWEGRSANKAVVADEPRAATRLPVKEEESIRSSREAVAAPAMKDADTGLLTKIVLLRHAERVLEENPTAPISLQVIRMDSFDHLEELHGERVARMLLKQFSQMLMRTIRKDDMCARYGRTEFAILSAKLAVANVTSFSLRLRDAVEAATVNYRGHMLRIYVSIGVAHLQGDRLNNIGDLADLAEARVERAHKSGGNRVVGSGDRTVSRRAMFGLDQAAALLDACEADAVQPYLGTLAARMLPLLRLINQELKLDIDMEHLEDKINEATREAHSRLDA